MMAGNNEIFGVDVEIEEVDIHGNPLRKKQDHPQSDYDRRRAMNQERKAGFRPFRWFAFILFGIFGAVVTLGVVSLPFWALFGICMYFIFRGPMHHHSRISRKYHAQYRR